MKRTTLNFVVDLFGFTTLTGLAVTGSIIKFILPPGTGGHGRVLHDGHGQEHIKSLLSMGRHDWGDIHFYLAAIFIAIMLVHLILHYNWLKAYCKSVFGPSQKDTE